MFVRAMPSPLRCWSFDGISPLVVPCLTLFRHAFLCLSVFCCWNTLPCLPLLSIALSCEFLSQNLLCCLALPCLACLALPCLPCLAFLCLALPCPALPFFALPCLVLPCLALPFFALPCLVLPCLALPFFALPCLALPCLALLFPVLSLWGQTHTSSPRHVRWECWDWGQDSMRTPQIPVRTHTPHYQDTLAENVLTRDTTVVSLLWLEPGQYAYTTDACEDRHIPHHQDTWTETVVTGARTVCVLHWSPVRTHTSSSSNASWECCDRGQSPWGHTAHHQVNWECCDRGQSPWGHTAHHQVKLTENVVTGARTVCVRHWCPWGYTHTPSSSHVSWECSDQRYYCSISVVTGDSLREDIHLIIKSR